MITHSLAFVVLLNKTPMELFASGGVIMWPILLVATVGATVIIERLLFIIRENSQREPEVVAKMLECVEKNDIEGKAGRHSIYYAREYRKPWKLPVYKI